MKRSLLSPSAPGFVRTRLTDVPVDKKTMKALDYARTDPGKPWKLGPERPTGAAGPDAQGRVRK